MPKVEIHFLGAAETVTGSKYLLRTPSMNILVDCGLFQGVKKLRELNWQHLPIKVSEIDVVLLTHGHLDHTGFLPRLADMGYTGPIWGTAPTMDITEIILRDSAKIQEEDAERANKEGFSKHQPAEPLYDTKDVERILGQFKTKPVDEWLNLNGDIRARFRYNGHILGATFIELLVHGKQFVFSGDIGRSDDPLLRQPELPDKADFLLLESTYGDRLHGTENAAEKIAQITKETVEKGGTLIIPSFAVERAQLLMYLLWQLRKNKRIPSVPIILDSPMGASVLQLFQKYPEWHKLSETDCNAMTEAVHVVQSFSETWEIIDNTAPKIVIAGSGMVTGGRVLTYLKQYIKKPETTILLAGYQAEGTRGRQLLEGCTEIKFFGEYYPVKAKVESLQSLSAHADQQELLDWTANITMEPERVYLIHGEPQATDMLRLKLKDERSWKSHIPALFEIEEIEL